MNGSPPRHYPVIIVGAGPTGLTLANLLGIYGTPFLLIERNAATVHEPRAVSIDDESLRTMQAAGLVDTVMAKTVTGYGSHYYSASGRLFAKVQPTEQPYGFPRRNAFRQPVLEAQLREALARFPHCEARFGHDLIAFAQHDDRITVRIRHDDREDEVACDDLIACDGASSGIRRQLGIALGGSTFRERWLIVDLENSPVTSPHTKMFCNPARPCIALPGPELTRRYEFLLFDDETDADMLAPATVQRLLATHEAAPESRIVRTVVYTFHARLADRWKDGRVLLAGDAAHLTPPFAGQGMNSGLRDANNLAWKLAAVVRGDLGPALLESYEAERRGHAQSMIDFALSIGRVLAPRNRFAAWRNEMLAATLSIVPGVRDYIMQMKFKPPPRFDRGFLVKDGLSPRRTLVGKLFPQPNVRAAGSGERRFDDVLGQGFSIVVRSPRATEIVPALRGAPWDRLKPTIVVMGQDVQETAAVPALADFNDHVFVLRPDRYVAACIPAGDLARGAAQIDKLIAATLT